MQRRSVSISALTLPLLLCSCAGSNDKDPSTAQQANEVSGENTESTDNAAVVQQLLTGMEVPGQDCALSPLADFADLPTNPKLPNPFVMQDGSAVTTTEQWACRHREIRSMVERYETGVKLAKPEEVSGTLEGGTFTVTVSNGADVTESFPVTITYPEGGEGPYPAMIGLGGGSLNNERLREQGVALIDFDVNPMRPEGNRGQGVYTAYTGNRDAGALIAWAWGVSRVIDALEVTPGANIKADRLGITGCSRLGKGALMVGSMDSRLALSIPQESGSGGTSPWRAAEYENETAPQGCENPDDPTRCVQKLSSTYTEQRWFGTAIEEFSDDVNKLPLDHHELIAMGAPRGMLALGNIGWRWLGRYSGVQGMAGAREVYRALGVEQNIGFVESGHFHCNSLDFTGREQEAIDAYVAKFLLDQDVSTDFWDDEIPFDRERWVDWETPTLQ